MLKPFDLSCKKANHPHFSNTASNLDCVGPYTEQKYYGTDYMSGDEWTQFFEWYEEHKHQSFCNKQNLFDYCMDDVICTEAGMMCI